MFLNLYKVQCGLSVFFYLMLKIMCQCVCVWTKLYCLIVYFVFIYKVEYMLVKFDHENKKVRLILCGEEIVQTLQDKGEKVNPKWVAVSIFFFFDPAVKILCKILLTWLTIQICYWWNCKPQILIFSDKSEVQEVKDFEHTCRQSMHFLYYALK